MTQLFNVIHVHCGRPAFKYSLRPLAGMKMEASRTFDLTGRLIDPTRPLVCGTCGFPIHMGCLAPDMITYDLNNPDDVVRLFEWEDVA